MNDEFVAFGSVLSEQELQEKIKTLSDEITERGYSASIGYQMGSTADSMNELMRIAETKMCETKAAYYSQAGHDRKSASR